MSMNMMKRMLSLLLALTLLLGNVPAVVFATGDVTEPVAETETAATEEVTVPAETELPTQPETVPEETSAPTEEPVPSTETVEETVAPTEEVESTEAVEPTEVVVSDEAAVAAANIVDSGAWDTSINWCVSSDGVLTISGRGSVVPKPGVFSYPWEKYCDEIKSLVFEEGITVVQIGMFHLWAVTNLSLPASMTGMAHAGFSHLGDLKTVTIASDNPSYCVKDNVVFTKDMSTLVAYPIAKPEKAYSIPDGVSRIENSAGFLGSKNLVELTIPASVTSIGHYAISECPNLKRIIFEGDAPALEYYLFYDLEATVYYPANNATWTSDVMQDYGGDITWIPYDPETDDKEDSDDEAEYHNTLAELTEVDYLAFAQVAYEDFVYGETVQECLTRENGNKWDDVWGEEGITYSELCEGIAQWKVCHIEEDTEKGFYAVAFRNESGEAVLAYRGSKPLTDLLEMVTDEQASKDWIANDLSMILFNEVTDENQYNCAIDAYKETKKVDGIHTVVTTGHSLGGLWGEIASAYSGCEGITFNAISALDTMYVNHPIALGRGFQGIDAWNFMDQINVYDILAGAMEAASSDLGLSIKLKPFVAYSSNYGADSVINSHSLKSLISRSGDKLVLNQTVGSWVGNSGTSGHLASTSRSIDMGISGNDYFDKGLKLNDRRSAFGGNGTDYIYTSIRDDTLVGGRGNDRLDGSWGDDTYYYFKGDGSDTIIDIGGHDRLCLEGFEDSDLIEMYEDKDSDYISIRYDGSTIVNIYKKNRDYSVVTSSSFRVYINGGQENNITEYFSKYKSGSRLLVQCPVSVEILDADGNVVYTLQDGAVGSYYTDYGNFYVFEEENGGYGKVLDLAAGYTARIVGEDTGSMKIEYRDVVNGELSDEAKNFADVPVSVEFTATFEETEGGELVLAADTDADGTVDTKLGYDGKPVPVESLELAQEYIALKPGEAFKLHADVKPAELTQFLCWDEEDSENILHVEQDGTVIGQNVGTAYVLVTVKNGDTSITERCRVDVAQTEPTTEPSVPDDETVEKIVVEGIQLSTNKVTTELYRNEFATFEILLDLPQNRPREENELVITDDANMAVAGMEKSNLIESVRFTSDVVNNLFKIEVLDDRTVQIVPDYENAVKASQLNSRAVLTKYTDTITVTVEGKSYVSEPLTINVKKTMPKLKATVAAFNSFYDGQTQPIVVTGGTATSIYENESKNTAKTTAIPNWLTLNEDGTLALKPDAPLKSVSGSAYVMVETAEWRIPVALTVSVKNTYKAPGLKLSATTVTASTRPDSGGVSLKLLCTNKNDTLSSLNVTDIIAPEGYEIENFSPEDGSFILKAEEAFKAEKITLQVDFDDAVTTNKLNLNLTIKTAAVALKLASTSVKLNQAVSDSAKIKVTVTPADYRPEKLDWQLTAVENKVTVDKTASEELDIRYENGELCIYTTEETPEKATYKLSVSAGGSKKVTATINVVTAEPAVSLKATGSMDLSFPDQTANIAATFTNYNGVIKSYSYSVAEVKGKTVIDENVKAKFHVDQEGKTFKIRCVDEGVNLANTYAVTLKMTLEDGRTLDKTINLKVKRTIVKLKLSATKLSLNKLIGDEGSITVTCATKGYAFEMPVWTLTDSKNVDAAGELDIRYEGDKLYVGTKDETVYGKTYKITLKADAYGTASVLTIAVPLKEKSTPTMTIKAAGKVDVIRDGSAVTITPTYKNCITTTSAEATITICNSKREDVTDQFEIVPNGNGGYTVTKAENGKLVAGTYKVKLVAMFGETKAESKEISMSVVMGSVKLTSKTSGTTLFAKDRNDRALVWFESTDAALNEVSSITFKNATQAKLFEIIPYGDGLFAIGFKDGKVDGSLIATGKATGKTVTVSLNVFVDGNATTDPALSKAAKANTTVSVKLTIMK